MRGPTGENADGDASVVMPAVSYAQTGDGVHLAYSRLGSGAPVLVAAGPMLSCQSGVLGNARAYGFLRILSQRFELILYDERGTGSSGGTLESRELETDAADLVAVAEAAGLEEFSLLSAFGSAPCALEFAATRSEAVGRIVLWAPLQCGSSLLETSQAEAILGLGRVDPELAFRVLLHALAGWETGLVSPWLTALFRETYGLLGLQQWLRKMAITDERLEAVTPETLVIHPGGAALMEIDRSRHLTASIPNARMMLVEAESIVPYSGDVERAAQQFIDAISPGPPLAAAAADWGADQIPAPHALESPLTSRERDVLRLIAGGDSSKEIASQLDISVNTVDRHISNIYRKLGVRGRAQAAAYAVKQGIG